MRTFLLAIVAALSVVSSLVAQQGVARLVPPTDTIAYFDFDNTDSTKFFERYNIRQMDSIPDSYRIWWELMKLCTGLPKGKLDDWKFFEVDAESFTVAPMTIAYVGWTFRDPERRMYVVKPREFRGTTVPHEMIHALLFDNGKFAGHNTDTDWLMQRCGVL